LEVRGLLKKDGEFIEVKKCKQKHTKKQCMLLFLLLTNKRIEKMQLQVAKYSKKSWWIMFFSFGIIGIMLKNRGDINEN
jgi:hypothetical protein